MTLCNATLIDGRVGGKKGAQFSRTKRPHNATMIMTSLSRKDNSILLITKERIEMRTENLTTKSNMTFRQLYKSLPERQAVKAPKAAFVERMAEITCKSTKTVWGWISGAYTPDPLTQKVIEAEIKIPATVLFPKEEANV